MKHRGWKTLVLLLVLTTVLFMTMGAAAFAASGETVSYVDAQGRTQSAQATPLTGDMTAWESGWYVVQGSVSIEQRITVRGTVNLILADGAKLDARQGITTSGAELTIYGQSAGTGTLTATGGSFNAGIGGGRSSAGGTITINGGTVTATGSMFALGIGGGLDCKDGTITINGGTVTATGGESCAGIGGTVTINGGTVTAFGGLDGAGISDTVTINGGMVSATGGLGGAGIGGGLFASGGTVTINGGTVNATAGAALWPEDDNDRLSSAIGHGEYLEEFVSDTEVIHDGTVAIHNVGVYAGDSSDSMTEVTGTFELSHSQRFVKIVPRDPVPYLDWNDAQKQPEPKDGDEACTDYFYVTAATTTLVNGRWYVVEGNVTVSGRMTVNGAAHLILTDGSTLIAQQGITTQAAALTIYGQSEGSGRLVANGIEYAAGIGGVTRGGVGTVTINGGSITATGGRNSAGIGNGYRGGGGTVIINSGTVTATGGISGSGISGTVIINGGTVTAAIGQGGAGASGIGGTVTINGGTVTARGGAGATGIGGTLTVNGGTVTATGGHRGAGIDGKVTINGGDVTARSGDKSVAITGTLTLGEGMFLYSGENYVPQVDGDYARSMQMRVNSVVPSSLTVTYNLNGGTGKAPTDTRSYKYKDRVTVLPTAATREGCYFKGWNTKADGSGTAYVPGDSKTGSFAITGSVTLYAQWARLSVAYLDWDGTRLVDKIRDEDILAFTDSTTALADGKWYVVNSNVTVKDRISVSGTAHLILCDGMTLEAPQGIGVAEGNSLMIHGQSGGTGRLNAGGSAGEYAAGIGGGERAAGGTVVINGGTVTATGGKYGAGIGGGFHGAGGTMTLNGGTVRAAGGTLASGIGGGQYGNGGTVTVNDGSLTAVGGYNGAGIGGGMDGEGGTLTVNGGTVSAKGDNYGMGIGGGSDWMGGSIDSGMFILHGGTVTAEGGNYTAGIGGTVTLDAGVTVWAGSRPNPRSTGSIVTDFAENHSQRYVYVTNAVPTVTGADLVLDGMLKLRFYASVPSGAVNDNTAMDMTVHGRTLTQKLSDAEKIDGKYAFACPVYPIEMAEPVTAVLRFGGGTAEKTVSVREYLDGLEAKKNQLGLSAADTAKLTNMITAVRNYGHYMQPYLASIHNFTVGEGKDYRAMPAGAEITPLAELPAFRRVWGEKRYDAGVVTSIHYYDDFKESTTLNIDLKLKSRPASVTAAVDGKAWNVQTLGDNSYHIAIPDIAANNLGKAFHVELTADGRIVYDAKLSALSYVSAVLDARRDNPDEAKALTAFYQYYEAAKAFEPDAG